MLRGTKKRVEMKTFSGPREFALAFAAWAIPGMRTTLAKYDEQDREIRKDLAEHEARAAPIRADIDAIIAAHKKSLVVAEGSAPKL